MEVRQVGIQGGVGDADVDNAADTGADGGLDQAGGIFDGKRLGGGAVVEADPVGVEEHFDTRQRTGHAGDIKVKREGGHLAGEGIGAVGVAGEGDDLVTGGEQAAGDVLA